MPYQVNKPQPNDDLDISVTDLQQNFLVANTVMDIDHYPFNNLTANKGFHKTVTSPDQTALVATAAEPKLFGYKRTASLDTLQFSRGPNNSVATPVTYFQSPQAQIIMNFGNTTNVADFTGVNVSMGRIYMMDFNTLVASGVTDFFWNGTAFLFGVDNTNVLQAVDGGSGILQVKYAIGPGFPLDVFWTCALFRLQ